MEERIIVLGSSLKGIADAIRTQLSLSYDTTRINPSSFGTYIESIKSAEPVGCEIDETNKIVRNANKASYYSVSVDGVPQYATVIPNTTETISFDEAASNASINGRKEVYLSFGRSGFANKTVSFWAGVAGKQYATYSAESGDGVSYDAEITNVAAGYLESRGGITFDLENIYALEVDGVVVGSALASAHGITDPDELVNHVVWQVGNVYVLYSGDIENLSNTYGSDAKISIYTEE